MRRDDVEDEEEDVDEDEGEENDGEAGKRIKVEQ